MLSQGRIGLPQPGQREGGDPIGWSLGMRWMQTLAKLPTMRPKAAAVHSQSGGCRRSCSEASAPAKPDGSRSEEHTSELQSRLHLVCRLLLEKKKTKPAKMYLLQKKNL